MPTFAVRFSVQIPLTAASNGTVTVQAAAVDATGAQSLVASLSLPVRDGISPTLSVLGPVNNSQVVPGQAVPVVFDASDDVGVSTVAVVCNPSLTGCETRTLSPAQTATRQTFTIDVPADLQAPATIVLALRATDAAGNTTQATRTLVVPDTVRPVLTLLQTESGSARVVAGQVVAIRAAVTDNVGVTALTFQTEGALVSSGTQVVAPPVTAGTATFTIPIPPAAPNGSLVTVRARARDQANNSSDEVTLLLTIGDTAAPTLTILSPNDGASFAPGQTVTLSTRVTDDSAVQRIVVTASGVFGATVTRELTPPAAAADVDVAVALPASTPAGQLTLTAEAFDAVGNSSGVVTRALLVRDVVAPQVVITAPVAGASVDPRNPLLVSVTGTDQVGVTEIGFNAAGATSLTDTRAVTPAAAARTESFSVVFGTPPISGGTLTLGASSRDAAGNVGTAAPVVVSVLDVVAPDVAGVTPANGASGVDPATTIVVTFTEPMDRATLNGASVVLASGGTAVAGALAFSPDDRIATLTPIGQPLALNTTFTLTVGTGAQDRAGNQLAAPRTFTFTTASPDTAGPRVLTMIRHTTRSAST